MSAILAFNGLHSGCAMVYPICEQSGANEVLATGVYTEADGEVGSEAVVKVNENALGIHFPLVSRRPVFIYTVYSVFFVSGDTGENTIAPP